MILLSRLSLGHPPFPTLQPENGVRHLGGKQREWDAQTWGTYVFGFAMLGIGLFGIWQSWQMLKRTPRVDEDIEQGGVGGAGDHLNDGQEASPLRNHPQLSQQVSGQGTDVVVISMQTPTQVATVVEAENSEWEDGFDPPLRVVKLEMRTDTDETLVGNSEEDGKEKEKEVGCSTEDVLNP